MFKNNITKLPTIINFVKFCSKNHLVFKFCNYKEINPLATVAKYFFGF